MTLKTFMASTGVDSTMRRVECEVVHASAARALHAALKLAEWGNYDVQVDLRSCPVCAGSERTGHTEGCALRAALDAAEGYIHD